MNVSPFNYFTIVKPYYCVTADAQKVRTAVQNRYDSRVWTVHEGLDVVEHIRRSISRDILCQLENPAKWEVSVRRHESCTDVEIVFGSYSVCTVIIYTVLGHLQLRAKDATQA